MLGQAFDEEPVWNEAKATALPAYVDTRGGKPVPSQGGSLGKTQSVAAGTTVGEQPVTIEPRPRPRTSIPLLLEVASTYRAEHVPAIELSERSPGVVLSRAKKYAKQFRSLRMQGR
jgi:hypothetical protein